MIVQDPCHLRHVQRAHEPSRALLATSPTSSSSTTTGLCCGAGGAYSALQPELAGQIRDRKVGSIEPRSGASAADVVASANPGCSMHLAAVLAAMAWSSATPSTSSPTRSAFRAGLTGRHAMGDYEAFADRLEAVAADLDDMAFDRLREAVADGELTRPRTTRS